MDNQNTKYFHACAFQRKKKNQIHLINDNDDHAIIPSKIDEVFVNLFKTY